VLGVDAAALGAANFAFNEEPVTFIAGILTIGGGAILPFGGTIENTGTIALVSTGGGTELEILVENAMLQGGGQVTLSDDGHNVIFGGAAEAMLINVDNIITGAGRFRGHIEATYTTMWERYQRGEAPESFAVAPAVARDPG
jgi:hypothetical protein